MRAVIVSSSRFVTTPNGETWAPTSSSGYRFWRRYLDGFDEVRLLTRTRSVLEPPQDWVRVTGEGVESEPVPDYHSPLELLRVFGSVRAVFKRVLAGSDALIVRVPSLVSGFATLRPSSRPYGVEVVGDPLDVFAPGAFSSPLRPAYQGLFAQLMRWECRRAVAAAYVTAESLQRRYPPAEKGFSTHYSSIQLPAAALADQPRTFPGARPTRLVFVGTLAQLYKAPDVLIEAVALCLRRDVDIELQIVGDGQYRRALEAQCRNLGIEKRVGFRGRLPGWASVSEALDAADLFVLPSRQEGLPRAMIEAMARGLPCLGARVGGIPELLPERALVPAGDATALAHAICEVVNDPGWMTVQSKRNLDLAREYCADALRPRRVAFYDHVARATAKWWAARS